MTSRGSRAWALRLGIFLSVAVLGGGCDLRSKEWAEDTLREAPRWTMSVIDPYVDLALSYNRGTAFSVVGDLGDARWVFGAVSLLVVLALLVFAVRSRERWTPLALGLVAGGAIGNGFDRLFREAPGGGTGVVDFIRVHYPWGGAWPTFNVADALVAVGVAILLVRSFRPSKKPAEPTLAES